MFVGLNDSLPGHALFDVRAGRFLPGDRFAILDGGSDEIRVFDASGELVLRFGSTGAGPEQFLDAGTFWIEPPDTLAVWDAGGGRFSYWSMDGRHARTERPHLPTGPEVLGRLTDGSLLARESPGHRRMEVGQSRVDSTPIVRLSKGTLARETITRLPYMEMHAVPSPTGGRAMYMPMPLTPRSTFAASENGFWYSDGSPRILHYRLSGEPSTVFEVEWKPRPVDRSMWETWIEGQAARAPDFEREAVRRHFRSFEPPVRLPAIDTVAAGDNSVVWVRHYAAPGEATATWAAIKPGAGAIGEAMLPVSFRPLHIQTDRMLGVVRDAMDREIVLVVPITLQPDP